MHLRTLAQAPYCAAVILLLAACSPGARAPEPDAPAEASAAPAIWPSPAIVLTWTPEEKLAGFPNYDRIFPTRAIPASDDPYPLPENLRDVSHLRYEVEGETFGLEDFLEYNHVAGLMAIKDGEIVVELYRMGNDRDTKWVSYSVAKSVVSLLVGAALNDGFIGSVDQPVTDYLPLLAGSAYDRVTIRDALQMASGVEWNEDYADPESDVTRTAGLGSLELQQYLADKPRAAEPGKQFNYNTGETHLVGSVVRNAIGTNLSTYLAHKIWTPFGMESDANWMLIQEGGAEHGGCCISATLRDYGRIGLFALNDGVIRDGTRILPEGWMEASTTPSTGSDGYGYLWWLRGGGVYNAIGIFGQAIVVDPGENLVIATHSAWPQATGRIFSQHQAAFLGALTEALRDAS